MKILITGSHGFVGTNLIETLSGEHEIVRWDARSNGPLQDCDAVIHLAGLVHDVKNTTEQDKYFEVNTELTKRIYDRFLESGAKKFLFFSSIKAQDGDTAYAISKRKAELAIRQKEEVRRNLGKEVYILRPCMIHGKGNKGNLNLLVKWMKMGLPWPLAAFENKRSFASMGNVSFVVDRLLCSDVESGIFNVCDDKAISTNELIGIICDCLGNETHLWRIPKWLMEGLARLGDVLHLPLNTERLGKLTENCIVSNREIKLALGIDWMPVDAKVGLRESIRYLIKEQK